MKALQVIANKQQRTVWLRAFRIWQRKPHEVAPLSTESHDCSSCGTTFTGNYCPRCGQSARIGRFSFKKAFLLFLDVWGLGNRGMFRSLRDLILRPGYMIRDYVSGKQSAYFPPFKMFFLLTAFSLFVEHGFSTGLSDDETKEEKTNIEVFENTRKNVDKQQAEKAKALNQANQEDSVQTDGEDDMDEATINGDKTRSNVDKGDAETVKTAVTYVEKLFRIKKKYPALFSLFFLVFYSAPLFLFFRKTPNIPDLRYSELIVALIYTSNMFLLYSIFAKIINFNFIDIIAIPMIFVAFKQFSGFSKSRVFWYLFLSTIISLLLLFAVSAGGVAILYYKGA